MALHNDWGYSLAQQFLDAAVSCGAQCANRLVVPYGFEPPGGCLGDGDCTCRLMVGVLEGYSRPAQRPARCELNRTARIEITLDVCAPRSESDGNVDPVTIQTAARDHAALRWTILEGIRKGWRDGNLHGGDDQIPGTGCAQNFTPGPWESLGAVGACLRYRSVWNWSEAAMV